MTRPQNMACACSTRRLRDLASEDFQHTREKGGRHVRKPNVCRKWAATAADCMLGHVITVLDHTKNWSLFRHRILQNAHLRPAPWQLLGAKTPPLLVLRDTTATKQHLSGRLQLLPQAQTTQLAAVAYQQRSVGITVDPRHDRKTLYSRTNGRYACVGEWLVGNEAKKKTLAKVRKKQGSSQSTGFFRKETKPAG